MARQSATSLTYLAIGDQTAIRVWSRRDRRDIARWPDEQLPAHWRDVAPVNNAKDERLSFAVDMHGDNNMIGRISLREIQGRCARLGIVLHPELRGRGLGRDALAALSRLDMPLQYLILDVAADNTAAVRCYVASGWVRVAEKQRNGHLYLEMAKSL